ncbi:hypothetical protein Q2296_04105 [Leptospira kirschneri]
MLEIQGTLLFLPALLAFREFQKYFLDKEKTLSFYKNENFTSQKDQAILEKPVISKYYSPWFLCISPNLLFHTKYTYVFIFFCFLFLIVFHFDQTREFIFKILNFYGFHLNRYSFFQNNLSQI